MMHRNGTFAFLLALLLAGGCTAEHSTGEGHEQAAEETDGMAAPPVTEKAMKMEEPVEQAAAPATTQPVAPPPPATAQPAVAPPPARPAMTPPPAPAQPAVPMVQIPEGTILLLELRTELSTATNAPGDEFKTRVLEPVAIGGVVVIPERSRIWGTVTEAISAKRMKGQAHISLTFDRLELPGGTFHEMSAMLTEEGVKMGKRTGAIIGGTAAGGAILGRIIGDDSGDALKGALIGAAVGTGIAAAQKGKDLEIPKGTQMSIILDSPLDLPEPR